MLRSLYISVLGRLSAAVLMLVTLLWLSVSTPFVYAAQQTMETEKNDGGKSQPMAGIEEEKSEHKLISISEYLHQQVGLSSFAILGAPFQSRCYASFYQAYHPDQHCPPPNVRA